jgi:hypothetical protein
MEARSGLRSAALGLRIFDLALGVLLVALTFVTVVVLIVLVAVVAGSGSQFVRVEVSPPYTITFPGNRSIEVTDGSASHQNFEVSDERGRYSDPSLRGEMLIGRDDRDARIVVATLVVVWLALSWVALVNLRRVVKAARARDPFAAHNAGRLRWVAGTLLAVPVVIVAGTWALDRTVDSDPAVHVVMPGPAWWMMLTLGLGVLALAEVFRHGAELHELERTTI